MPTISETIAIAWAQALGGNLAYAEQLYGMILAAEPGHAEAHHGLGVVALRRGQYQAAADSIRQALRLNPAVAAYHNNLGLALQNLQEPGQAAACFRQALQVDPNYFEAHNNLGTLLKDQGRLEEAIACYQSALQLRPDSAEAHNNLAVALRDQGRLEEAVEGCRRALQLSPASPVILNNLGGILADLGQLAEARACCERALQLRPQYPQALHNLATALHREKKIDEAGACYRRAVELEPRVAWMHHLARTLKDQGKTDEATACLQHIYRLEPSNAVRYQLATVMPVLAQSVGEIGAARRRLMDNLQALLAEGVRLDPSAEDLDTLFYLVYQGLDDRAIHEMVARLCAASSRDFTGTRGAEPRPDGRTRLGFVSRHLNHHTIGWLWKGLIARLSREKFAVTVFELGRAEDSVTQFLRGHCDQYVRLPLSAVPARQRIAEAGLDVLYYTDIGMDPTTYALAVSRLAPVQCVTWGHPATSGLPTVDYFLSSELLETEEADAHYTEKLVRLKTLGLYVSRPEFPWPRKRRADFGLPEDRHLYACLQAGFKFQPEFDSFIGDILRRDPRGLFLLPEPHSSFWKTLLWQRLERTIPDVVARVQFIPWLSYADYLRLIPLIDALLVPPQFGGGKTTYDAFAFGLPVVTLPSPYLRGRITYALYRAMGVLDCVAHTPEEYVDIAVRLGTDRDYRDATRAKILGASHALFEDAEAVREVEVFLDQAVAAHSSPDH